MGRHFDRLSACFKHDPRQVLARYFDAFLYRSAERSRRSLANWGSKRLAFRFPKPALSEANVGLLNPRQIEPYLWEYCIELKPVGDYLILDISLDEEEGADLRQGEGEKG